MLYPAVYLKPRRTYQNKAQNKRNIAKVSIGNMPTLPYIKGMIKHNEASSQLHTLISKVAILVRGTVELGLSCQLRTKVMKSLAT